MHPNDEAILNGFQLIALAALIVLGALATVILGLVAIVPGALLCLGIRATRDEPDSAPMVRRNAVLRS